MESPRNDDRAPIVPRAPREPAEPRILEARGRIRSESLDPDALHVVSRLQQAGHEAYLVGGCVRDLLLGLEPKDFDVATDAPPNRIKRLFRSAFVIGRRFRLVHVRFQNNKVVEAATFRRDPGDQGAHPDRDDAPIYDDNVFGTAIEDAFRRDFTVNALFYDPTRDRVIDHVGGLADLEARVIRAIGDPDRRLKEDPVRMTRAVHFAARIGGTLEPELRAATLRCAEEISKSSGSRLYNELVKILARGCAGKTLRGLFDLGVLKPWLPDLCEFLEGPIEWPSASGGTHEAAREGEPAGTPPSHLTWNLLGAADAWGMGARGVPESLEMSVLLGPWILSEWDGGRRRGPDFWTHAEEIFRPMALRMNVPRRTSYEMRDILGLQERLREPPDQKRRQRSIVERSVFPEALAYFQLDLRARGRDLAPVTHWREIADEVWRHERRTHAAPVAHPPIDFEPGVEAGPVRDPDEAPSDERSRADESSSGLPHSTPDHARDARPARDAQAPEREAPRRSARPRRLAGTDAAQPLVHRSETPVARTARAGSEPPAAPVESRTPAAPPRPPAPAAPAPSAPAPSPRPNERPFGSDLR